ncbi:FUSC family protein [Aquabacter cavernae]|uniref:FUSC family protein n=1 Tax=Aquabacter cavernae TaxID=2496029 RepID=UPI0013E03368|nr:aromatic acid exporter family protein [Aquabacter cavernae]
MAALITLPLAKALNFDHPVYAFIASIIVTDLSPRISRRLGLVRVAATMVGTAVGAALGTMFPAHLATLGLGIFLSMVCCQLARIGEGAKVAGYISGLILVGHMGGSWDYAINRFLETLLGVGVAWSVSLVPRLIRFDRLDPAP